MLKKINIHLQASDIPFHQYQNLTLKHALSDAIVNNKVHSALR